MQQRGLIKVTSIENKTKETYSLIKLRYSGLVHLQKKLISEARSSQQSSHVEQVKIGRKMKMLECTLFARRYIKQTNKQNKKQPPPTAHTRLGF